MSTNDENLPDGPDANAIDSAALDEATDAAAPLRAGLKYGTYGLGALLVAGSAGGLYWLAAASVISIVAGVVFSWVALVEILR